MNITLSVKALEDMIDSMSRIWEAKYVAAFNPEIERISERTAFKVFGESNVRRWLQEGKITFKRMSRGRNSKKEYSYSELIALKQKEIIITSTIMDKVKKL